MSFVYTMKLIFLLIKAQALGFRVCVFILLDVFFHCDFILVWFHLFSSNIARPWFSERSSKVARHALEIKFSMIVLENLHSNRGPGEGTATSMTVMIMAPASESLDWRRRPLHMAKKSLVADGPLGAGPTLHNQLFEVGPGFACPRAPIRCEDIIDITSISVIVSAVIFIIFVDNFSCDVSVLYMWSLLEIWWVGLEIRQFWNVHVILVASLFYSSNTMSATIRSRINRELFFSKTNWYWLSISTAVRFSDDEKHYCHDLVSFESSNLFSFSRKII